MLLERFPLLRLAVTPYRERAAVEASQSGFIIRGLADCPSASFPDILTAARALGHSPRKALT
jgi:hypothetical protein